VAASIAGGTAACDLPTGLASDDDGSSDYAQICTDAAGDVEPDSDCAQAPESYDSVVVVPGQTRMWRYYGASNLSVPPYGTLLPGGMLRRPVTVSSGGSMRTPVIKMPSVGPKGGTLSTSGSSSAPPGKVTPPKSGSDSTISRGGFGVKGGSSGSTGTSSGS
jgi:hypothetical protein